MIQRKPLANSDTAACSDEFVKDYLNNYLASQKNENCSCELNSEVIVIKAQVSNNDIETNTSSVTILDSIVLSNCQSTSKIEILF